MEVYVLVHWPESQAFMDNDECLTCDSVKGALFVPKKIYDEANEQTVLFDSLRRTHLFDFPRLWLDGRREFDV